MRFKPAGLKARPDEPFTESFFRIGGATPQAINQAPVFDAPAIQLRRITTASDGSQLNGATYTATFSPDGTKLAFFSAATNATSGDGNGFPDVFIKDLLTGMVTLVSTTATGQQGNGASGSALLGPIWSSDGTKLMFDSDATNFVAYDGNPRTHAYIKDLVTGTVAMVSTAGDGTPANVGAFAIDWSADGSKVLLYSDSNNLVADDTNGFSDLFVKDLVTGAVTRVSTSSAGAQSNFSARYDASFSPDGTKVLFATAASNFAPDETGIGEDIFVKDLVTGAITLVSRSAAGVIGDAISYDAHFSPDGTKVLFTSQAGNLVAGDTNNANDIYLKDLITGQITRVSSGPNGEQMFSDAREAEFSPDGTMVTFMAQSSTLPGDTNGQYDLFVKNLVTGAVMTLWEGAGSQINALIYGPLYAPDGAGVAFFSLGTTLVGGDTNFQTDIVIATAATRYIENAVPMQILSIANVSDPDSANYAGGTLSVAITAGSQAGDRLVFTTESTGPGFGLELVGNDVRFMSTSIGTLTSTDTSFSILLKAAAEDAGVLALVRAASIFSLSDNPGSGARTVTFTLIDGGGTADGGQDTRSFTRSVAFSPIDDPTVAQPDYFALIDAAGVSGNLFADNYYGIDSDVDNALTIGSVNGTGALGQTIVLASGALLVVNADGSFNYDANNAFGGFGATDGFTYAAPFGNTVTVTIQIAGAVQSTVAGTPGADIIVSGAGVENLIGLAGDDTYYVDHISDVVTEAANEGRDIVYTLVSFALSNGSSVEVISAASLTATTPLTLAGNAFNQDIYGNAGNNLLQGGGGSDYLVGLGGDDQYIVASSNDRIVEAAGGGRDAVYALASYVLELGAEIEVLSTGDQSSTMALELVGNAFSQDIYGNAGSNLLQGGGGDDYLIGLGGDDSYLVDGQTDRIVEILGGGRDAVYARSNYRLEAGAEIEVLSAISQTATTALELVGNEYNQDIYGNAGNNLLQGGGGNDFLVGLEGDDQYIVLGNNDRVVEIAGQGRDVVYTKGDYTLDVSVSVEILSAADQTATTAMRLTGSSQDQEVYGNAGANVLDGGGGTDYMGGLGGNDTYFVSGSGDHIIEAAGQGSRDVVYARASYALEANQEIEVLAATQQTATTAMSLTGNNLVNELYGNDGANTINGGGGSDFLAGYGGADIFAFTTTPGAGNVDQIVDFNVTDDTIALDDAVFAGLATGALAAGALVNGTAAADADDRIVYNSATGQILFDADGNGAGLAVLFATVSAGTVLTASDFTVI